MQLFISQLFSNPQYFLALSLMVIFSICLHEFCHAWTALRQGDPTAADAGHLTLNPLKQMGIMSLIMFAMLGIAWGQVPVNPARMRHRWSHALVALAGPGANLVLAIVFASLVAALAANGNGEHRFAAEVLFQGAALNLVLLFLNLLPVPGLDGWTVLTFFFPRLLMRDTAEWVKGVFVILIVLLFVGVKYLFYAGYLLVALYLEMLFSIFGIGH